MSIIGDVSGYWQFDMEGFLITITEGGLHILSPESEILITKNAYGYVNVGIYLAMENSPLLLEQIEERGWEVDTNQTDAHSPAFIEYYPEAYYTPANFSITSPGLGTIAAPLPAAPLPPIQDLASFVWFTFVETVLLMTYGDITVTFYQDQIVITYVYISITIYFWFFGFIERNIIMFFEFTFIFYFTIVELILVIIYESVEIKYYYSQIVIIYESIEIILIFISITIWQLIII
ncbi:MAG TPA: hypothetical protein VMX55_02735 [candidate division Zixibacteria bacterium]|nr:hypothetical protein [candidate division Zixibacteria bacterium]